MHPSVMSWLESLSHWMPNGMTVLEVGSYNVNGSARDALGHKASKWVGVDLEPGPGVDVVVPKGTRLFELCGERSFDVVVCCEALEHVEHWQAMVTDIKRCARTYAVVTTRSDGFPYHAFPEDHWRYELEDIAHIFGDYSIIALERDPEAPGVFLFAQRPYVFVERKGLDRYRLKRAPAPPKGKGAH